MDEVKNYETELKSMTGGKGSYTMELSHYDIVPSHLVAARSLRRQRRRLKKTD